MIAFSRITLPGSAKVALSVAAIALASSLSFATPAAAQWHGHGGYGGHPHFYGGWGGGYRPRPYFYGGPAYFGGYYAPPATCYVRRRWVPGPYGWHWMRRRFCTY